MARISAPRICRLAAEILEDRVLLSASALDAFYQQSLAFEANVGQTDAQVQYLARGLGYGLFLTGDGAVLNLYDPKNAEDPGTVLQMRLVGGNSAAPVRGLDQQAGQANYYIGNDPAAWHTGVARYGRVEYDDVYSGIDLVYYGTQQQQLEYDFVVAPGADPSVIRLDFEGADGIEIDGQGNLVLHTSHGDILQHAPVIYQDVGDERQSVSGAFTLAGNEVGFSIGAYDHSRPLVIDPTLVYSTYLGGSGVDQGLGIYADAPNSVYITGYARSPNFPLLNAADSSLGGSSDAFLARISNGALSFSTYFGGSGKEDDSGSFGGAGAVVVVPGVGVFVTGSTQSANFPVSNAYQSTLSGTQDAFIARFGTNGNWSSGTYLGGTGIDAGTAIYGVSIGGGRGRVTITGWTTSADFPLLNPEQAALAGGTDAFVAALAATFSPWTLSHSTYLGGSGNDVALGLGVDAADNMFLTGRTFSSDFPTTAGLDTTLGGASDAFVSKINAAGNVLLFSTYLGGSGDENGDPAHGTDVGGLALDSFANVYVAGSTSSANFPLLGPADGTLGGSWDAFVTKLDPAGVIVYSTYLGGGGNDVATSIAVDGSQNAFMTGYTESADFPVQNATQAALAGSRDAFVSVLDSTGFGLVFSTYLGGPGGTEGDIGQAISVDPADQIWVTGFTDSAAFPIQSPHQAAAGGAGDAFITRLAGIPGAYILETGASGKTTDVIEGATTDTYTVVLTMPPTLPVVITLNPDSQLTVSPATLTFAPGSWNVAQTVTVTAADDALLETQLPNRHTGVITHTFSGDPAFTGVVIRNVTANITDNDVAGVVILDTRYGTAIANGGTQNGSIAETGPTSHANPVVLTSRPTATVVITLASSDGQTTVSPSTLTFTPANWFTTQNATVTAVDDALAEAVTHYGLISHTATSADPSYNGIAISNVSYAVVDNDTVNIDINHLNSVTVIEGGPNVTFTISLPSAPTGDVVITLNGGTQVNCLTPTFTFTPANWSVSQNVTVAAVDDALVESTLPTMQLSTITFTCSSADTNWNGFTDTMGANIRDNDTVGIYLGGGSINVAEAGPSSDTFILQLNSVPAGNVYVTVTPDAQATVAPTVVTFTPANWYATATINVTAVDDGNVEGAHTGVITHTVTGDPAYAGWAIPNVTPSVTDDDVLAVVLSESLGSTNVSETGATDGYQVRLGSRPSANVLVTMNPDAQLSTSPAVLTFTPATWNIWQIVTVSAVDDQVMEVSPHNGILGHTVTSADAGYNGLAAGTITARVTDNDTAGVTLTESGGATNLAEGGAADTYAITLATQPTANVLVTLGPDAQIGVSASVLTFTPASWNVPQTVTITAVDDFMVEVSPHQGIVAHIVSSADPFYSGLSLPGVTANITDNDIGGVAVTQSGGSTDVTEGFGVDIYTIVLSSRPTANVSIAIGAGSQLALSTSVVVFTPANWNVQQTVTVTAVDDAIFEGPHTGVITHAPTSADPVYNGVSIGSITASITDNDAVGILQSGGSTSVSESGGTDTYNLVLASMPTANVVVTFSPGSQLAVNPAPLTFTPASWNVAQTVTVSAVNDMIAEGSHSGVIRHTSTSADANYNGVVIVDVTAQIADNDIAGATVTASGGSTVVTEGIGSDLYDIVLNTQPTANVSVTLTPDAGLVVAPAVLVFTPGNWNVPQFVTVIAPDDGIQQGPRTRVISHSLSSSDPFYQPVVVVNLPVNLLDPPGVTITAANGTNAVIEGSAQSYTVKLNTAPTAPVTIDLTGDGQVAVSPSQVTFSPSDWNVPRPLIVTATDDGAVEGPHSGNLDFTVTSADPTYSSLVVSGFTTAVIDNDGTPVMGTSRADRIVVAFDATRILVTINNQVTTLPLTLSQLVIQAGDGNDSIQIVSPTVPVVVVSGRGTDKVFATGQNGANSFVLDNGAVLVNGVGVQLWETESLIVNGRAGSDTFSVSAVPGFTVEFKGDAGNDEVVAGDRVNTWQIAGPASGSLDRNIKLTGIENWTGGSLGDSFVFAAGKSLGGRIDGGGGSDVLDYSAYTGAVAVNLGTSTASGTTGFANIGRIVGGKNGADKLTGPDQILVWDITGANAGTVGGIAFQSFENLTGGAFDDVFRFGDGQSIRGKIDGGGGLDRLDYGAFATKAVVINLQTKTATSTAGFLNVEQFTGGGTLLDTLIAANVNNAWTLTGRGVGTVNAAAFTGFDHLTGGTLNDTFSLTTALSDWLGTLNGGAGNDVLTGFSGQPNLYVNTALNAGTLNGHKFVNVESRR